MNQIDPAQANQNTVLPAIGDVLGLNAAIQTIRRRFFIMLLVGGIAAAATLAYLMSRPQVYEATALVSIVTRQERVLDNSVVGDLPREASAIDSEIEMLRSSALMGALADSIRRIEGSPRRATAPASRDPRAVNTSDERDALADELAGKLTVRRRGLSYVLEISARDPDPARAQLIANTFVEVYITSQIDNRVATNERANSWLGERLAQLRDDVREKESAAETFRVQSGQMAAQGSSLVETQITNVQTQVLQAQADLAETEARYQQVRAMQASGASIDTIGNALNSTTIQALREREADIARRQSDFENRYLPSHPAVQSIRAEREDVARQIQSEFGRISTNLANEVQVARARLRTLQGSLSQVTGELGANSTESVRLRELEREAAASREVYEAYLQRYEEIANQDQLNMSDARLMAHAQRPTAPASPDLKLSLVVSIALGLMLGFGAGILLEIFDQSVKNADDLENRVGVPAIATIPVLSRKMLAELPQSDRSPAGYLALRPMSAFTEALRVLRTMIVYSKLDMSTRVVAITSALPDEGKTTVSISLARVAAMSGQKVVVVDCDLRKQSLNDIVDVHSQVGILHVLAGEKSWREAIVRDSGSEADVLPVATPNFTPRDVFGTEAMSKLISDLREAYDLIILDCAPIMAVAETRIVVEKADAVVIVARAGRSPIGAVRAAVTQTQGAGGNILGVALNCVEPQWRSYTDSLYFYQAKSYYSTS